MKTKIYRPTALIGILSLFVASCADTNSDKHAEHDHSHEGAAHSDHDDHSESESEKREGGPNGGRLVTSSDTDYELRINPDRTVSITLLDQARKPVAPADQSVTIVGGDRSSPTTLSFNVISGVFQSDKPLPDGNIPVIAQFKESESASIVRERFTVNLSDCPSCDYQEYACVCGH